MRRRKETSDGLGDRKPTLAQHEKQAEMWNGTNSKQIADKPIRGAVCGNILWSAFQTEIPYLVLVIFTTLVW